MSRRRLAPEERKRVIAEAVLSVTVRGGLEAASVRDVAAEAGVSAGMVQHHFKTKDEMLLFACEYMVERTAERTRERIQATPDSSSARSILRSTFEQMLPLDEERKEGLRVWISFLARAVVKPDLEAYMREVHRRSHEFIADQIRRAQREGELPAHLDPERETVATFMLVEGLVSHVQIGHYTGEEALRAVDDRLDELFG